VTGNGPATGLLAGTAAVRSVLVVELLGGIGDLLLALPAVHALARSHPGARVTVLTFAPGDALLAADPHVHEVVRADPGPPERQAAAVAALLRRGFDLVVTDTRYGGIPALCEGGARVRAVTDLWRQPPADERIDLRFLRLLAADGVIDPGLAALPPAVALTAAERHAGRRAVPPRTALLVPGAGMSIKEWAPARVAALGRQLVADGWAVRLPAGRHELAAGIAVTVGGDAAVLPPSDLRGLAAVAAACAVCVAGDTGPARLATAVGTPTVALYGPTWAGRFGLRDGHVSLQSPLPCHVRDPGDQTTQSCWYTGACVFDDRRTCTDELTVEDVAAAVRRVTGPAAGRARPMAAQVR